MNKLILKAGREKSLKRRHPWVFSGAIAKVEGRPDMGETVEIRSGAGETLAFAAYSPHSQIRARVWSWTASDIDARFFTQRIEDAASARAALGIAEASDAWRLVHGESDGLPGVIADRYGETVVMQILSAGGERWRDAIADALCGLDGVERVWERSDADVRELEGLKPRTGLVRGTPLPGAPVIREHGLQFKVEIDAGHKTGFYLDQRDNRLLLRRLTRGRDVLDCFSYTGGFAMNALGGGARSLLAIDSSALALEMARANAKLNALPDAEWLEGDVFQLLRRLRDERRTFDVVVLDPPKFAPTAAHAERASRAYKDINLLALKLLRPGGFLVTFSCSGGVSADLFQKIVAGAALDAGVDARIESWLHAAPDHPVGLSFPESEYLKGLLVRLPA
ncbi:MAG TPA: class I SAM-dependent methyltransferase [Burkholderiales bacterium]|nr:class I SAM-dependent methyltransferase [Burkholderiales bacterium]